MIRLARPFRTLACAAWLLLGLGAQASAYPLLQLTTSGGIYDQETETTFATSARFTLYAYLTPPPNTTAAELSALLSQNYYIAAAIAPKVAQTTTGLGEFSFNGQQVHATADMVWGTPPVETYFGGTANRDPGDLGKHDIYDTYFKEFSFNFTPAQRATPVDVEQVVGQPPSADPNGGMYYMAFQVDTEYLDPAFTVHFDMYDEVVKNGGDIDIDNFAPFSHDASSMVMPEPGTLTLLGTGVAALLVRYRRRRSATPAA